MTSYAEIRSQIRPFDFFLFSGEGAISNIIKLGSGSKWSHVGLALRLPEFPRESLPDAARELLDAREDRVLILESTTLSGIDDLLTGLPIKGVQIVPFSERLESYKGDVAWRPVVGPRDPDAYKRSALFVDQWHGTPYEKDQLQLARAALDFITLKGNQPDTHSLFCSEMAILHHRICGLMWPHTEGESGSQGWPANEFTPGDFAGKSVLPWMREWGGGQIVELG